LRDEKNLSIRNIFFYQKINTSVKIKNFIRMHRSTLSYIEIIMAVENKLYYKSYGTKLFKIERIKIILYLLIIKFFNLYFISQFFSIYISLLY